MVQYLLFLVVAICHDLFLLLIRSFPKNTRSVEKIIIKVSKFNPWLQSQDFAPVLNLKNRKS
jgi:hypothetical protein